MEMDIYHSDTQQTQDVNVEWGVKNDIFVCTFSRSGWRENATGNSYAVLIKVEYSVLTEIARRKI